MINLARAGMYTRLLIVDYHVKVMNNVKHLQKDYKVP